jgi:hypothetical protein
VVFIQQAVVADLVQQVLRVVEVLVVQVALGLLHLLLGHL